MIGERRERSSRATPASKGRLLTLRATLDLLHEYGNDDDLFPRLCEFLVGERGYLLVWIGRAMDDGTISILARAGPASSYADGLDVRWDGGPYAVGPAVRVPAQRRAPVRISGSYARRHNGIRRRRPHQRHVVARRRRESAGSARSAFAQGIGGTAPFQAPGIAVDALVSPRDRRRPAFRGDFARRSAGTWIRARLLGQSRSRRRRSHRLRFAFALGAYHDVERALDDGEGRRFHSARAGVAEPVSRQPQDRGVVGSATRVADSGNSAGREDGLVQRDRDAVHRRGEAVRRVVPLANTRHASVRRRGPRLRRVDRDVFRAFVARYGARIGDPLPSRARRVDRADQPFRVPRVRRACARARQARARPLRDDHDGSRSLQGGQRYARPYRRRRGLA